MFWMGSATCFLGVLHGISCALPWSYPLPIGHWAIVAQGFRAATSSAHVARFLFLSTRPSAEVRGPGFPISMTKWPILYPWERVSRAFFPPTPARAAAPDDIGRYHVSHSRSRIERCDGSPRSLPSYKLQGIKISIKNLQMDVSGMASPPCSHTHPPLV